jgi:molybdate transport system substrate-binding protein
MHPRIPSGLSACLLLLAAVLAPPTSSAAGDKPVVVYAAASMKNALETLGISWRNGTGHEVRITFAATSTLARKIEQGAAADVFISAGTDWMDYLAERKLVGESKEVVGNRLVLIAPRESKAEVLFKDPPSFMSALGDGNLAVARVDSVPAGRYARASLESLGLWDPLQGRLMQADDVRAAMEMVAQGKAPLGIVYATDAKVEPRVRIVNVFADSRHAPIRYLAAPVSRSSNPQTQAFLRFLSSPAAGGVFAVNGFVKLNKPGADEE